MHVRSGFVALAVLFFGATATVAQDTEPRDNTFTTLAGIQLQAAQAAQNIQDTLGAREAFERALELSLDGIADDEGNPRSYYHAGVSYLMLRQYEMADSMLNTAVSMWSEYEADIAPLRENAWANEYNAGLALLNSGDTPGAVASFERANALYDARPEAHLQLGNILGNGGDPAGSVLAYQAAIDVIERIDNQDRDPETLAGWAQQRRIGMMNMAQMLRADDRSDEAITVYERLLEEDADDTGARSALALTMSESGQEGDALSMYTDIIANPVAGDMEVFNAGVGLYTAEAYEDAAVAFGIVVERNHYNRDALVNLVQSLIVLKQWEEVMPFAESLVDLDPRNEFAYRFLITAVLNLHEDQRAQELNDELVNFPFYLDYLQLRPNGTGAQVVGGVLNRLLEPASKVTLRFHFYGADQQELGTQDVVISVDAADVVTDFSLGFVGDASAVGYSYEIIG